MAALRGPDSSEDERRLGEQAVFPETVDVNIRQLDPIPAPRAFLREQPLTDEMSELVLHSRQGIRDVLERPRRPTARHRGPLLNPRPEGRARVRRKAGCRQARAGRPTRDRDARVFRKATHHHRLERPHQRPRSGRSLQYS